MAAVKLKANGFISQTPISNLFIDNYMIDANHTYSVIYLFTFRWFFSGEGVTTADIADKLKVLETDVFNAFEYWAARKLLKIHKEEDEIFIEFLPVPDEETQVEQSKDTELAVKPAVVLETKPVYSEKELDIYLNSNDDVRLLFKTSQEILGKPLNITELSVLLSFYDWLRLPIPVIEVLLNHCVMAGRANMRYIEKAAIDWCDKGIDTPEKAHEYIKLHNKDYREIMKSFGLTRRDPAPSEIEYMNKWLKAYKMPVKVVKEACKRTILNISQASFPYADKIIMLWRDKGVKNIDDIEKLDENFTKRKESKVISLEKASSASSAKKNRFVNYEQRDDWDFEKLETMQRELIKKEIKD